MGWPGRFMRLGAEGTRRRAFNARSSRLTSNSSSVSNPPGRRIGKPTDLPATYYGAVPYSQSTALSIKPAQARRLTMECSPPPVRVFRKGHAEGEASCRYATQPRNVAGPPPRLELAYRGLPRSRGPARLVGPGRRFGWKADHRRPWCFLPQSAGKYRQWFNSRCPQGRRIFIAIIRQRKCYSANAFRQAVRRHFLTCTPNYLAHSFWIWRISPTNWPQHEQVVPLAIASSITRFSRLVIPVGVVA